MDTHADDTADWLLEKSEPERSATNAMLVVDHELCVRDSRPAADCPEHLEHSYPL